MGICLLLRPDWVPHPPPSSGHIGQHHPSSSRIYWLVQLESYHSWCSLFFPILWFPPFSLLIYSYSNCFWTWTPFSPLPQMDQFLITMVPSNVFHILPQGCHWIVVFCSSRWGIEEESTCHEYHLITSHVYPKGSSLPPPPRLLQCLIPALCW